MVRTRVVLGYVVHPSGPTVVCLFVLCLYVCLFCLYVCWFVCLLVRLFVVVLDCCSFGVGSNCQTY